MIYVKMPDGKEMGAMKGFKIICFFPWDVVLKYWSNSKVYYY